MSISKAKFWQQAGGVTLACAIGFQMVPGIAPLIAVARADAMAATSVQSSAYLAQRLDALAESLVLNNYVLLQQKYVQQQIDKLIHEANGLPVSVGSAIYKDAVGNFSWIASSLSEAASIGYYGQPNAIANELVSKTKGILIQNLMQKYSVDELNKMSNQQISQAMSNDFSSASSQSSGNIAYNSNNPIIQYLNNISSDSFVQSLTDQAKVYFKQQAEDYFKVWIRNFIQENITTKISSETVKSIPYVGPFLSWYLTQRQKWMNNVHQNEQKQEEGKLDRKKTEYENEMKRQEGDLIWGRTPLPSYPRQIDSSVFGTSGGMNSNQRVIEQFAVQDRGSLAEWLFYGDKPVSVYGWLANYPADRRAEIMKPYVIGPRLDVSGKPVPPSDDDKENVRRNAWLTLGIEPTPPFTAQPGTPGFQEELAVRAQYTSVVTQSYDGYMKGWMFQDRINQLMSTVQMFTPQVVDGLSVGQTNGCSAMLHQLSSEVQLQIFQSQLRFERLHASSAGMEGKMIRDGRLRELGQGAPVGTIAGH
ncbi:hypothetical protein [Vogesella sp. XCS3]|uniref:hypothetical protein n=1 Tax=Vogesella sp. XCS3 TaxID=2877939 RepID=UPI001D09DEF3|nr:hypothetical protein [Vogesella sp. XCS3]UDM18834.1 hypothetical protein LCH97_18355 [Vogesella sp. XCS3]